MYFIQYEDMGGHYATQPSMSDMSSMYDIRNIGNSGEGLSSQSPAYTVPGPPVTPSHYTSNYTSAAGSTPSSPEESQTRRDREAVYG